MTTQVSQLVLIALAGFLCGGLCVYLIRRLRKWVRSRRAKIRFIQFVDPDLSRSRAPREMPKIENAEIGWAILDVLRDQETDCELLSLTRIPKLGEKPPNCYICVGRCLALLDAFSSCVWQCSKSDHVLDGRGVNCARASLRLAQMGFYDEALNVIRSVGEIANLLSLFNTRRDDFETWKKLDDKRRLSAYSPVKVRERLAELKTPIRVEDKRYSELCDRTHVNPRTSPQSYNWLGVPFGAGYYQEAGLIVCLNELALSITFIIFSVAQLSHLDSSINKRLMIAGRELIGNTGRLAVDNIDAMWHELLSSHHDII